MKHSVKKLPGSKAELEVMLTPEEFNEYWKQAYDEALGKVHLKGFRPGTAPKEMAQGAVNKEKVFETAANNAVRFSLNEITEDNKWNIIDQPKIEITDSSPFIPEEGQKKLGIRQLADGGAKKAGLKYKVELTLFPEIALPDYKKIANKVLKEKKEITVEAQEIQKTVEWLQSSRAKLTRAPREAKKGDLIDVDIESFLDKKPIEGGAIKADRFVLGESKFIPGFDEKLENKKEGELLEFSLVAPENYWQRNLQNKEIEFKVKINSIFERELPEINDEFARTLGNEFQGLESLKANIKSGIKLEKQEKEKERIRAKIIDEIVKSAKIDPPKIMIDKSLENMIQEVKQMSAKTGGKQYPDEELKKHLESKARQRVLASLVIHKIAELEKLEPTKKEVEEEAKSKKLDIETYYDYCYTIIRNKKLFSFLEKNNE